MAIAHVFWLLLPVWHALLFHSDVSSTTEVKRLWLCVNSNASGVHSLNSCGRGCRSSKQKKTITFPIIFRVDKTNDESKDDPDRAQGEHGYWEDEVITCAKFIVSWKLNPSHLVPVSAHYKSGLPPIAMAGIFLQVSPPSILYWQGCCRLL